MSNIKNCKVDTVSVSLRYTEDSVNKLSFEEILKHPEINGKEFVVKNKSVHFSVVEENEDYIIGFVRSIIDKDLPAKINKRSKQISALDLHNDEGIAYGNVLLYSKRLKVLFYEVNKNSIYLDLLKTFIYKCFHSSQNLKVESIFETTFATIFRKNEYERALRMSKYKSFRIKVYQPKNLLQEIKEVNSSLEDKIDVEFLPEIKKAATLNSDFAEIEFKVENAKKSGGLYKNKIEPIIKSLGKALKFGQIRQNIDTVEICGYDNEYSTSQIPIDLVGDVYCAYFKIDVPRLDSDLMKDQRIASIKEVYEREFPILADYL